MKSNFASDFEVKAYRIDIEEAPGRLLNEIGDDQAQYQAFTADINEPTGSRYSVAVVYNPQTKRGGATVIGNGSSGSTTWFDGDDEDQILEKFVIGEDAM